MEDPIEITGFEYIGGIEELEGYELGMEYPKEWIQSPQEQTTQQLSEITTCFVEVYTPFPTPKVPRPKK